MAITSCIAEQSKINRDQNNLLLTPAQIIEVVFEETRRHCHHHQNSMTKNEDIIKSK
jgi:hypothetical protein